ncbi:MAG: hypothetical protein CVV23_08525 [Ignavibacteriae bacterium HGW-Ignavibacteriae-2]|jgi:peptidoglycan/xylan/chitin deacetylase (PgdA/CDA1 family)|nr:MAG: hypothetical protein CVV23_08525 [Ignavibacteriae bacterium HGW-Ignavibacteriae-2]
MKKRIKQIAVLAYHSIGKKNINWNRNFLTVEFEQFQNQLEYISKKFNVISLNEYYEIRSGLKDAKPNSIVITIDDGYLDNWIWAYPSLKKYGLKATIFISPEFVDPRNGLRPNLDDVEPGKKLLKEVEDWGYLTWDEMRSMEESGLIDIQSHTMTHTKYFISDKLMKFHYKDSDSLYVISNLYPEKKPYHINNLDFNKLIPIGYPIFEEASSVIARKVTINPDFNNEVIDQLKDYQFTNSNFDTAFNLIKGTYLKYRNSENLIIKKESESEYLDRVTYELKESKSIIEKNLNKEVKYLCWPHGDNNEIVQKLALEIGYKMTTAGILDVNQNDTTRIPWRIGIDISSFKKKLKFNFKLSALLGEFPYSPIYKFARYLKKLK